MGKLLKLNKKSLFIFLLVFILSMGSLTGCGSSTKGETSTEENTATEESATGKKELTISFNFATNTLDPAADRRLFAVRCGVGETLVKISQDLKIEPWIAESWESDDKINWNIQIKDGITFSNGKACDAKAVMDSIQRLIDNNTGLNGSLDISSMSADGQTLTIVTNQVHPSLISDLGHPQTCIVDVGAEDMVTKPIGTGPYMIENFTENAEVTLVKNPNYWDGEVNIDTIHFQTNEDANVRLMALQSQNADAIFKPDCSTLESIKSDSSLTVDSVEGIRDHMLLYNTTSTYTADENFRKAIDCLIDRETIKDEILYGEADVAVGCFAQGFDFTPDYNARSYSMEDALNYFEQAGLTVTDGMVSDNGNPITLDLITYTSQAEFPAIAQLIQANLASIGITANINTCTEDIDSWLAANDTGWDIAMYSIFAVPRGDASYFLNMAYTKDGVLNYARINDEEIFSLIDKFNTELDEEQRNEYAKQAAGYAYDKCYNSYIVHPRIVTCYNNKISGWVTSKMEYYIVTKDLDVMNE